MVHILVSMPISGVVLVFGADTESLARGGGIVLLIAPLGCLGVFSVVGHSGLLVSRRSKAFGLGA